MGFIGEWFAKPFNELEDILRTRKEIIVVETSKEEFKKEFNLNPELHKVKLFRPTTFEQYIGQERAKTILKDYIAATKSRGGVLGHVLLSGEAGGGKTTLAKIIAREMNVNFLEIITSTLRTYSDLLDAIEKVNGGILFLDEIHGISRDMAESIYSIMEDFQYNGKEIKKFTLIGATTELGELEQDRLPFVNRFKIPIELEEYKIKELSIMANQYRLSVFPHDSMDDQFYEIIAKNSRGNPRTVNRMTESLIYMRSMKKVLRNFGIIKDGYTHKDLKVLKYVALNEKGVGLQGLASYLGTSAQNYLIRVEPFLLRQGLILRTPRGRKITPDGLKKIKELDEKEPEDEVRTNQALF